MKRVKRSTIAIALGLLCMLFAEQAHARQSWQGYRSARSRYSFGRARPVTGYGSNIHRNFVLKQEARRASQGQRVRNRGNILWNRY